MTRPVTLSEPHFSQHTLNKYASLMAQGNGYLGLRASHEEDYTRQTRGMYLAGLYHRAGKGEINELVNLPDILGMEIAINGEVFSLSREAWQRELDFASGELRRSVVWRTSNGTGYTIASRRFVSADQLPLIVLEITITPLDADASVLISTGIGFGRPTAAHCAGNHYYATGRRRVSADFNRYRFRQTNCRSLCWKSLLRHWTPTRQC
ncbi:hypothetical protein [Escherichia coli]|uniref:hypothetical protein n=1 Tax=Escherichia coli TaxID=562 RepID=UPI00237A008B|nr:hypothetical protein [Escherichia coli]